MMKVEMYNYMQKDGAALENEDTGKVIVRENVAGGKYVGYGINVKIPCFTTNIFKDAYEWLCQ